MKFVFAVVLGLTIVGPALADCGTSADDKKLAGAARTSFLNKCKTDVTSHCNQQATDKKLSGAARNSFTSKCIADGTGF